MRIVVDTNVFLGACLGAGPASAVIAACLRGQAIPLMGDVSRMELNFPNLAVLTPEAFLKELPL